MASAVDKEIILKAASKPSGVTVTEIKHHLEGSQHAGRVALLMTAMARAGVLDKTDEERDGKVIYKKATNGVVKIENQPKRKKDKKGKKTQALKKKPGRKAKAKKDEAAPVNGARDGVLAPIPLDGRGGAISVRRSSPIVTFFDQDYLPMYLQKVIEPCRDLAHRMEGTLPDCAEKTTGLRKLLEAKDAFIRAAL